VHELRGTLVWAREASPVAEPGRPPGFAVRLGDMDAAARAALLAYAASRPPYEI
jgi:hypothetical protein